MSEIKLITSQRGSLLDEFNDCKPNKNIKHASSETKWICNDKNRNAFTKTVGEKQRNIDKLVEYYSRYFMLFNFKPNTRKIRNK